MQGKRGRGGVDHVCVADLVIQYRPCRASGLHATPPVRVIGSVLVILEQGGKADR